MVPLVFLVIVATVAIYGLGVGRLAERLGLATASPQGVVLAGGPAWAVGVAELLDELGVPVVIVSDDPSEISSARMAGVRAERANILSDYAVRDMDLAGMKTLVALTDGDERNATAAREFAHVLGRGNVFQLAPQAQQAVGKDRTETASHLTARTAFAPALGHAELAERVADLRVKRTSLTEQYTFDDFQRTYDGGAIALFTVEDDEVEVVTEKTALEGELTLIALVPSTD